MLRNWQNRQNLEQKCMYDFFTANKYACDEPSYRSWSSFFILSYKIQCNSLKCLPYVFWSMNSKLYLPTKMFSSSPPPCFSSVNLNTVISYCMKTNWHAALPVHPLPSVMHQLCFKFCLFSELLHTFFMKTFLKINFSLGSFFKKYINWVFSTSWEKIYLEKWTKFST